MDRDQRKGRERDLDKDPDRMWAATRLTEAAVTQLFQGASTPVDASRGHQIGQIVAELYSAIYTGEDVQSKQDARPSLAERMANAPARSPILPRPSRIDQSGPTARPIAGSSAPAVGKNAGPAAGEPNLPLSTQHGSAEEAPGHQAGAGPSDVQGRTKAPAEIPEIGSSSGAPYDNSQDSLQSLLSEIGADAPEEEAPEERRLPPPEPLFHPADLQAKSLESQLASIASQGPMEPEMPSSPTFAQTPPPNRTSPRTPSPASVNSGVVVLETSEKRRSKWQFWKR